MTDLTTETVALSGLRPHPDNPRNGDTEMIAESLRVNGQYKPIVVAKDGTVIAGNHTYAAALSLGWEDIAVVRLPITPRSKAAKRIMLADNRTADLGRYDEAQLLAELRDLDDLLGTGYHPDDLVALDSLLHTDSYLDSDDYQDKVRQDAIEARRTIKITGLDDDVWEAWRALPGDDDLARLVGLLNP